MNELKFQLRREIERSGPISFARFMDLALYAPGLGYYERQTEIGRRGDFFTSVSVGSAFGELLAFQFAEWLETSVPSAPVQIVEAGGHAGTLAADILNWMKTRRPKLFSRLHYQLVEPSETRRAWQQKTLSSFADKVQWVADIERLAGVNGIIFSNELLDAMPAHRLTWDALGGNWMELRVALNEAGFAWQKTPLPPDLKPRAPRVDPELAAVLPQDFTIEISPAATDWWRSAARALRRGRLLTMDYGLEVGEQLTPGRSQGTLRTYSKHHAGGGLLDNVGEQDITAHVDFSALEEAGRETGLQTDGLFRQSKFLTEILQKTLHAPAGFGEWTPARLKQFQTLTHPEHLGRAFHVLIQSR